MQYASKFTRNPVIFADMNFKGHHLAGFIWPVVSTRTKEAYDVELTEKGFKCTCIGFNRHGKCKHITSIHDNLVSDISVVVDEFA